MKRTPEQEQARRERQRRESGYPKCGCGATLGLERVEAGISRCRGCLPDERIERDDVFAGLQEDVQKATTVEQLREVVSNLIEFVRP